MICSDYNIYYMIILKLFISLLLDYLGGFQSKIVGTISSNIFARKSLYF